MNDACSLADRDCVPCRGGIPPLTHAQIEPFASELGASWSVVRSHHIEKTFTFTSWPALMAFVNRVSDEAESMGHHPNLHITWGKVTVEIFTHKIDGLHEADFVLAARIDRVSR